MREHSLFFGRPGLAAILLFIPGIFIALLLQLPYSIPLIFIIITFFALTYSYLKGWMRTSAWLTTILIVLLGWYLTMLSVGPFAPNHIENLARNAGRVELVGKIVEEPDIRSDKTYLVVEADSLLKGRIWIPTFGRLRAGIKDGGSRYEHADIIKLNGYIYIPEGPRNPGAFDYRAYLRNKDISAAISVSGPSQVIVLEKGRSFLSTAITPLRTWLVTKTREYLSPLSAALLSGFILGEQRDIPDEYQGLFRNTGTLHLMAVSGSNVGVVLALFAFPLTLLRMPRQIKVVILFLVVVFFAILTRLQPSVVRASIMATVGLIAYGWIRKPDYINLLSFSGLLMLLWRPLQLFDVGVQLSFAATFGIIYALPKVNSGLVFLKGRVGGWLRNFIIVVASTVAAQLAVLPLMAHYFQNIPLSGVLANIPMIFLASLASTLGIAFYFSPILGDWLSHLISIPLGWSLNLVVIILRFFASLPYANIFVASPSWILIILFWLLLYFSFELLATRRFSKPTLIAILIASNILILSQIFKEQDDWNLEFLDLGRNHAWIYSHKAEPTVACLDFFIPQEDAANIIIPHILNHHKGNLDYLFTVTPNAPDMVELATIFNSKIISFSKFDSVEINPAVNHLDKDTYANQSNFPANIKIIWERTDNNHGRQDSLPAFVIEIGKGSIVLADWTGAEILNGLDKTHVSLLELPWSIYAQSNCKNAIEQTNPEFVVFSADRFTQTMPRKRDELTYSADRILSTSIFGGISLCGVDSAMSIETMKPVFNERK
jgi:ComEC/Rec2-related protein